jgi:glucose-1-phosphate thymidylyltransferase
MSKKTKGIILAGGSGTRLYPSSVCVGKCLQPIYGKPMIYYPLTTLVNAGINEILIITTKECVTPLKKLLKNGKQLGISIKYKAQDKPNGIAEAFIIGEDFIGNDNVTLILGDNIFYGRGISYQLQRAIQSKHNSATIFSYKVSDPERYGVVQMDPETSNKAKSIIEKPKYPKSDLAVTGLYVYDNNVIDISKKLKKSPRGELEITDVNKYYIKHYNLNVEHFDRGVAWLDAGTYESLHSASEFVRAVEQRTGEKIGCIEEASFKQKFINKEQLLDICHNCPNPDYTKYLLSLINLEDIGDNT